MESQGDPRVLLVMNLVLSLVFAYTVVWGVAFISSVTFSWPLVVAVTALLMILTQAII